MLYAHWEGFVKSTSSAYLEFVGMQKLSNKNLATNFLTLSARKYLREGTQSNKFEHHLAITDFYLNKLDERCNLSSNLIIKTESNLSSTILKEITISLGLDYNYFVTKEKLIDEGLVKRRNFIAHGEFLELDKAGFDNLFSCVIEMIDYYATSIENSAIMHNYKK